MGRSQEVYIFRSRYFDFQLNFLFLAELKTEETNIIESNTNNLFLNVFQETSEFWKEFSQQNGEVEINNKR